MKQLKTLCIICIALLSSCMEDDPAEKSRQTINIDGIYYNIISANTAGVTAGKSQYFGTINIPETITFHDATYRVVRIGGFQNSASLKRISMPSGITSFADSVFYGCCDLKVIDIPERINSIPDYAFCNCSQLSGININANISSIGNYAFAGCSALTVITSRATIPPSVQQQTFRNVPKNIPVLVPKESENAYKSAEYWKEFTNIKGTNLQ